jgi:hypothetical protein
MVRRLLIAGLLCALAAPATAGADVTIKVGQGKYQEAKYRETLYPQGFRIKGKTGAYRGQVSIESDEFPFEGNFTPAGTAQTNDKGEYVFPKVAPSRNARLRVRAGGELSKVLPVYVHPGVKVKYRTVSNGVRVKISFTYIGHPGFAPPENAFFAYIWINDRKPVRLGGKRTLTQVGDGRWQYSATTDLPSSRKKYSYGLGFCTRGLAAAGYGRTYPIDKNCGNKRP